MTRPPRKPLLQRKTRNALCWLATAEGRPVSIAELRRLTGWGEATLISQINRMRRVLRGRIRIVRCGGHYSLRQSR